MKNVFPNITDTLTAKFVGEMAQVRKLKKYWGTETFNGVEVFKRRKTFYPRDKMDESTEKFAKYIGAYNDLTARQEGIREAWLKLDIDAADDTVTSISSGTLATNLNKALTNRESSKVKVTIGAKPEKTITGYRLVPNHITDNQTYPTALVNAFKNTFTQHWLEGYSITTDSEDPYIAAAVMCALRNNPAAVEVSRVTRTMEYVDFPNAIEGMIDKIHTTAAYTADVEILIDSVDNNSLIVSTLQQVFSETHLTSSVIVSEIRNAPKELEYINPSYGHAEHWVSVVTRAGGSRTDESGNITVIPEQREYYLKADFFETTSLKRKDAIKYFMSLVGTDYRRRRRRWYQTLLVIVVIAVAFYFAGAAGAAAAAKIATPAVAAVVAISTTIVMASLYVSLVAYAFSKMGMMNVTAALGQFLRGIDPLARVAGVILVVASIYTAVQQALRKAAEEAVKQTATRSAMDAIIEIVKITVEKVVGVTSLSNMQFSHITRMTQFSFNIYRDWEMRNLEKELKNYRNELAELQEAEEQFRTSDIVKDMMAVYPNVLSLDKSVYAERYDRPYEWWSTPYHTGCMQANSVNALWLSRD